MKQFLILLKGKIELDYSAEALQGRLDEYDQWVTQINEYYIDDNRLERDGVHILDKDHLQTDGPFLETKEIIAGFIIIQASDLNQEE